jgi:hypothetical protein
MSDKFFGDDFKSNPIYRPNQSITLKDLMGPNATKLSKEEKKQLEKYKKLIEKRKTKSLTESEQTFIQDFFKQNLSNGGKVYSNTLRKAKY